MAQAKKSPAYNLKVVLQLTGIKPDTLRAWERRYGLPMPQRTGGGHRLYSQHDIEMIKWLMQRQEEGMRINRAVELWRNIASGGTDPLSETNPIGGGEQWVHHSKRLEMAGWRHAWLTMKEERSGCSRNHSRYTRWSWFAWKCCSGVSWRLGNVGTEVR